MGIPSEYDHPALAIFDRTLVNLHYIQSKQDTAYVFEFTALINSMLGIFVHPWDQLLNKGRLENLKWNNPRVAEWGFRPFTTSRPHVGDPTLDPEKDPATLGAFLRTIRNGVAHGNIELLDLDLLKDRNGWSVTKIGKNNDILAIEIWNCPFVGGNRSWGTVLSHTELNQLVRAMEKLIHDRSYWSKDALRRAKQAKVRLA